MVIYEERITLVLLQGPTRLKNKFIFMSNIYIFLKEIDFFCLFVFPTLLLIVANFPKPKSFYVPCLLPNRLPVSN